MVWLHAQVATACSDFGRGTLLGCNDCEHVARVWRTCDGHQPFTNGSTVVTEGRPTSGQPVDFIASSMCAAMAGRPRSGVSLDSSAEECNAPHEMIDLSELVRDGEATSDIEAEGGSFGMPATEFAALQMSLPGQISEFPRGNARASSPVSPSSPTSPVADRQRRRHQTRGKTQVADRPDSQHFATNGTDVERVEAAGDWRSVATGSGSDRLSGATETTASYKDHSRKDATTQTEMQFIAGETPSTNSTRRASEVSRRAAGHPLAGGARRRLQSGAGHVPLAGRKSLQGLELDAPKRLQAR